MQLHIPTYELNKTINGDLSFMDHVLSTSAIQSCNVRKMDPYISDHLPAYITMFTMFQQLGPSVP